MFETGPDHEFDVPLVQTTVHRVTKIWTPNVGKECIPSSRYRSRVRVFGEGVESERIGGRESKGAGGEWGKGSGKRGKDPNACVGGDAGGSYGLEKPFKPMGETE
ncbi:hypothetical protein NPIL_22871 [Nephila pilipes]|uniref:Uncharacterized protein n=1 Tax=Nephila pilipes TaxID=299642 RepID=A0A8X6TVZ5_NEPPI|nr:hypothetical protein NPIL_22871 [Nephila pilipes]